MTLLTYESPKPPKDRDLSILRRTLLHFEALVHLKPTVQSRRGTTFIFQLKSSLRPFSSIKYSHIPTYIDHGACLYTCISRIVHITFLFMIVQKARIVEIQHTQSSCLPLEHSAGRNTVFPSRWQDTVDLWLSPQARNDRISSQSGC